MDLAVYDQATGLMSPAPSDRKPSISTDEENSLHSPPASGHSQRSAHNPILELPPSPAQSSHKYIPTVSAASPSPQISSESTAARLVKIIQDPQQRRRFHAFVKSRFSEENLEFYVDVKKYHLAWESSQWDSSADHSANVMQMAFHIYGQYLRETSHKAVNVPRELLNSVEEKLFPSDSFARTMPIDLFDDIQQHCFDLMAHGNVNDFERQMQAEEEAKKAHLGELESLEDDKRPALQISIPSHYRTASVEQSHHRIHDWKQSTSSISSTSTLGEQRYYPVVMSRSMIEEQSARPKTARGGQNGISRGDDHSDSDSSQSQSQFRQTRKPDVRFDSLRIAHAYQTQVMHYDIAPWQQSSAVVDPRLSNPRLSNPRLQMANEDTERRHPVYPHSHSNQYISSSRLSQTSYDSLPRTPVSDYRRPSTSSNFSDEIERPERQETFASALVRRLRSKSSAGRESRPDTATTITTTNAPRDEFSKSTPSLILRRSTTKQTKEEKARAKEEKKRLKALRKEEPPLPPTDFVNMFAPVMQPKVVSKPKSPPMLPAVMNIASPLRTAEWRPVSPPHPPPSRGESISLRFVRKKTNSLLLSDGPNSKTKVGPLVDDFGVVVNQPRWPSHAQSPSVSTISSLNSLHGQSRQIKVFNVVTGESKTVVV